MNNNSKEDNVELAYKIIDKIDNKEDYNEILNLCVLYFPELDWNNRGNVSLRQFLLDEVINK